MPLLQAVTYSSICKVEIFVTLDTVGLVEQQMFGTWCNNQCSEV